MCDGIELRDLSIDDEDFSRVIANNVDASYLHITRCPQLTSVGFSRIRELQSLQSVWISLRQFGDEDCLHIPTGILDSCVLIKCAVTDIGAEKICKASPLLSSLDLSGCNINGDCFGAISVPNLNILNCVNCRSLRERSLSKLRCFAPKLRELKISVIGEQGLDAVCRLDDLQSLTIVESTLPERLVLQLAQRMDKLEVLSANVHCDEEEAFHRKVRSINRRLHLSTQVKIEHFAEYGE